MSRNEGQAREKGYPEHTDKRKLELHLEWAVRYQVYEMNPEQITEKYEVTDDREVRRQVRNLLELIGLEPRKPKRGG